LARVRSHHLPYLPTTIRKLYNVDPSVVSIVLELRYVNHFLWPQMWPHVAMWPHADTFGAILWSHVRPQMATNAGTPKFGHK
jgi:hypothetical protein